MHGWMLSDDVADETRKKWIVNFLIFCYAIVIGKCGHSFHMVRMFLSEPGRLRASK